MSHKISSTHLERRALVYVRQSTAAQIRGNPESTDRQYGLRDRATSLGWAASNVEVIDQDQGRSGATAEDRTGLQQLAQLVAHGRAGAILALEVSRLTRRSMDWQQLLRLCAVAEVLVIDEERVYDPGDPDDRLLLDFKGTMSEMELSWLSLRLTGARQNKARRGELPLILPTGYVQGESGPEMDPDEAVRTAIRTLFARFEIEPSACSMVRWAHRTGFELPMRPYRSGPLAPVTWQPLARSRLISILKSPIYAGVYAYGRSSTLEVIRDGKIVKVCQREEPEDWLVRILDAHPGYITWEAYVRNREKLRENANSRGLPCGAPREGAALLPGLLICGHCGLSMRIGYCSTKDDTKFRYRCHGEQERGGPYCWTVDGGPIDAAVEELFLETAAPDELELTHAVAKRVERENEELTRGWRLRLEQAEYEARLSERRYKSIDPDNRVVARTLERDWEMKLREVERLRQKLEEVERQRGVALSDENRARIRELASNLELVWRAKTTANADRKAMLRTAIEAVVLEPIDAPRSETLIRVEWKSGSVSETRIPRPRKGEWSANPPEAIERIRRWAAEGTRDEIIAERLNEAGLVTGMRNEWNATFVARARWGAGIKQTAPAAPSRTPLPDRHPDGRLSLPGAARLFEVSDGAVRYWIAKGLVKASKEDYGPYRQVWWLSIDEADEERLRALHPNRAPLPDRLEDGRYSIMGAARRFGVSTGTIRGWVKRGLVTWTREDYGAHRRVYWLEISDADAARLDDRAAEIRRRNASMQSRMNE